MKDKEFELFKSILDQMYKAGMTYENVIALANNIIFEVWKQMGARLDFIDIIIGGVTEPLRQAMIEYINKQFK